VVLIKTSSPATPRGLPRTMGAILGFADVRLCTREGETNSVWGGKGLLGRVSVVRNARATNRKHLCDPRHRSRMRLRATLPDGTDPIRVRKPIARRTVRKLSSRVTLRRVVNVDRADREDAREGVRSPTRGAWKKSFRFG
jgi:hypothetical protein